MSEHILITGGAGFIGSHVADELLRHGHAVRALDNLSPQVHGAARERPAYLSQDVELVVGDVRDKDAVQKALRGITAVYHFAAAVGVGQSMYRIEEYTSVNDVGTAVLLEALIERPVGRLIVASSMSVYGEGLYRTRLGRLVPGAMRSLDQLKRGAFEITAEGGGPLDPVPTPETKTPALESIYALSKYDQERLCLLTGRAYGIPTLALRFFNAYGPRQALGNPYTGVLAVFAARLLAGRAPQIFEDGLQRRDFVSVRDIARACRLALGPRAPSHGVLNVGSGRPVTVREVADLLCRALGKEDLKPEITGRYRMGDVRHCFADIGAARHAMAYEPEVTLDKGLVDLASWIAGQPAPERVADARAELDARGLSL